MRRLHFLLVVAACGGRNPTPSQPSSSSAASVSSEDPVAPAPIIDQTAPPASTTPPDDHRASAEAIYDATNYVAPAELAYSKTLEAVVYPACGGGEGPGEHCGLAAYDKAGKDRPVPAELQVTWYRANHDKTEARTRTIVKLGETLDKLNSSRMDRTAWRGDAPIELAGFGTLEWKPKDKVMIATRDGRTTKVPVKLDEGGPVNVYWSKDAPVAVAQLRFNPASGGREGYVVFIQLLPIPRP